MRRRDLEVWAFAGEIEQGLFADYGYVLTEHNGLGGPEERLLSSRGIGQIGATHDGSRIMPRSISLAWVVVGEGKRPLRDLHEKLGLLTAIFSSRLANDPVRLLFVRDDGARRQIDVHLNGRIEMGSSGSVGYAAQRVVASLQAADPRFYDPREMVATFALEGTTGGWTIPWSIPWVIAPSTLDQEVELLYAGGSQGAAVEFPVIRIAGPVLSPVIENETTGEKLAFTAEGGLYVAPGSFVEIDLRYDRKTAVNQSGFSVEQHLSSDSNLTAWHLAPAGEKLFDGSYANGVNKIKVTGFDASPDTAIELRYFNRYKSLY